LIVVGTCGDPNRVARTHLLVVDDDPDMRKLVRTLLERAGHQVTTAGDGVEAVRLHHELRPDAVLLDVDMPNKDGWRTLEQLRETSDVPVMMLTAHGAELEKVRGLRGGADDYVTKPFGRQELVARVEVLLRRSGARADADDGPEPAFDDGLVHVDHARKAVTVAGNAITLTPLEYRFLQAFLRHPGQVLSRDQLMDLVWVDELGGSRDQVKVYVGYLRRKLEQAAGHSPIETVRGFGYCYSPA
jgi:DNA-binding response OmpR family regulator